MMTELLLIAGITFITLFAFYLLGRAHNGADWGNHWLNSLDGLNRLLCRYLHRLQHDPIPLPGQGACLLASNHVSGLDPLLMIAAANRPLRFLIAREEYERFGLQWLFRAVGCIPVERKGRPEQALREALRTLRAGEVVAIFPHGHIHLDSDPPRKLKQGVSWLAHQASVPVIPTRLTGIRGQGHTLLAVLLPGRAVLQVFEPLDCAAIKDSSCIEKIAECIEGRK